MLSNIRFSQTIRSAFHPIHYLRRVSAPLVFPRKKSSSKQERSQIQRIIPNYIHHHNNPSNKQMKGKLSQWDQLLHNSWNTICFQKHTKEIWNKSTFIRRDSEFQPFPRQDSPSEYWFRDKSQSRLVQTPQTRYINHQDLAVKRKSKQIPRRYSTALSRTMFIRGSNPFKSPITIELESLPAVSYPHDQAGTLRGFSFPDTFGDQIQSVSGPTHEKDNKRINHPNSFEEM